MVDARRQRRMAHLGTLAGGLAHEIRNPLSTMKVNLQLLRDDLERDGDEALGRGRRRVETLEKAVRRLEEIVDDFLKFARGFDLELEPTDLNDLVQEVVVFVEPEAQRHRVRLRTGFATIPRIPADRKYLQQVLLNLILNARQAIEATGEAGEVFVTTHTRDGAVEIHVTDTGPGIPPDVLPRIFDVYFSTKKGGTGLGLPTCRRIVEEHGGRITVESEVGKGTSFVIHLPAAGGDKTEGSASE